MALHAEMGVGHVENLHVMRLTRQPVRNRPRYSDRCFVPSSTSFNIALKTHPTRLPTPSSKMAKRSLND